MRMRGGATDTRARVERFTAMRSPRDVIFVRPRALTRALAADPARTQELKNDLGANIATQKNITPTRLVGLQLELYGVG